MQNKNPIKIKCQDGFLLTGTRYLPTTLKAAIMIAPATGIKRTFYNSFATFLAENGYGVLTFDNRGIGDSRGEYLNKVDASLVNWGRQDMTAVLEELKKTFPDTTYHLVGHSAGGQLVGLMDNALELTSMLNFACSSGSIRNMKYPFKVKSHIFMNCFIPASNLLFGHTKSQWFGMGESLPKLVAAQWRKWCNGTGYINVALGKSIQHHSYNDITLPALWIHSSDDDIANLANVKDMIRVYPKMKTEILTLHPSELGYKEIGHMKFFSSKKKELWKYALEWFKKQE